MCRSLSSESARDIMLFHSALAAGLYNMIDIRKLKELVKLMVENDLSELDLDDKEEKVVIKRGGVGAPVVQYAQPSAPIGMPFAPAAAPSENGTAAPAAGNDDELIVVESPMVGTFYSKANPDAKPFVSVGANVSSDSVVCLIEAMKVFNEIKAEASGTIERVLVNDGDAVEFGQKLFLIKPA